MTKARMAEYFLTVTIVLASAYLIITPIVAAYTAVFDSVSEKIGEANDY